MPGERMAAEMAEQPARLQELIDRRQDISERLRAVAPLPLHGITMVARGSSDNAAVYGRYLLEAATGKPVSLAAPSLHTLYRIEVDYRGQLVIATSQSGATPEIVATLEALQNAGSRSPTTRRARSRRPPTKCSIWRWVMNGRYPRRRP
jgi:glucosamine--fructose-6-phosphate aminotransferase (isomerizing)